MISPSTIPFDPELDSLLCGSRRLVKRERVRLADVDGLVAEFAAQGLVASVDPDARYADGPIDELGYRSVGDLVTLFISPDAATTARALALHRLERDTRPESRPAVVAAMSELGALLGYPRCCVAAYLDGTSGPFFTHGVATLHLAPWHRTVGPFHWELNRFAAGDALLSHAPCSFGCEPSLALARAVLARREALDPSGTAALVARLRRPVLFWTADRWVSLDGPSSADAVVDSSGAVFSEWPDTPPFAAAREALSGPARVSWRPGSVRVQPPGAPDVVLADLVNGQRPVLFPFDGGFVPSSRPRRVAVVDLRTTFDDFFDNALSELAGHLRRNGVPTLFLRASVGHDATGDEPLVARLLPALDGYTDVVFAKVLLPTLHERLRKSGAQVVLARLDGHEPASTFDRVLPSRGTDDASAADALLATLIDLPPEAPPAVPARTRSDRSLPLIQGRREARPLRAPEPPPFTAVLVPDEVPGLPSAPFRRWYFHGNDGCPFARRYADPARASYLPASGVTLRGCAFCESGGDYLPPRDRSETPRRLVAQMTAAWRAGLREFTLGDTYPHPYLDELVDGLRAARLSGFRLLVQTRPDWFLRSHEQLLRLVPALRALSAELVLYLVGFENFAQSELDRLEKGLTVAQNVESIQLMRELGHAHAGAFSATRYKSHGFLLFNPWTTLDALDENAARLDATRFHEFRSHALLTRLRLYPLLPLFHRAQHEDLLVAGEERGARSSARRVGYAPEFAWRSADPRVDRVFELVAQRHDAVAEEAHPALLAAAVALARQPGAVDVPLAELAARLQHDTRSLPPSASAAPGAHPPGSPSPGPMPGPTGAASLEREVWELARAKEFDRALALATRLSEEASFTRGADLLRQVRVLALHARAIERFVAGDVATAAALYRDLIALAPQDAEAHRGLARSAWKAGDRDAAREAWVRFCELKGLPPPAPDAAPG